jgi:nicotinate-nucleotide adenylyltransferase
MKTVALLGGSFNPPHIGHLQAALYVRSVLAFDEVWLLPSFHHPFGKPLTAFQHRVTMCELMAKDFSSWLRVSSAESEIEREGRTIALLHHLLPRFPEIHFSLVIGSDIVNDLPKWKSWSEIERLLPVTILNRAGYPSALAVGPPMVALSSSEIRELVKSGSGARGLLPRAVLDYIQAQQLFLNDV